MLPQNDLPNCNTLVTYVKIPKSCEYPDAKVVGISFTDDDLEVITGGADGVFVVWQMPSLVVKQRFTRAQNSPLVSANRRRVSIAGFRS